MNSSQLLLGDGIATPKSNKVNDFVSVRIDDTGNAANNKKLTAVVLEENSLRKEKDRKQAELEL